MAQLIPADITQPIIDLRPKNGTDFTLDEVYALLSIFTVEVVPKRGLIQEPSGQLILLIDEEGKLTGKPLNLRATHLITFDDQIVGDALLCREDEFR